jgi:hypothetical protein
VAAAAANSPVQSDIKTISGINVAVPVTVKSSSPAAGYSINDGPVMHGRGTAVQGDRVQLVTQSGAAGKVSTVLTVGAYSTTWTVTTADASPNAFSWPDTGNSPPGTAVITAAHTISGINTATSVVSIGGDPSARYSINGGAFTNVPGATVNPGDSVRLMLTAGAAGTTVSAALDIGGTTGSWNLTSRDTTPDPFSFASQDKVLPGALAISDPVTITGINVPTKVAVSGDPSALVSVDGGAFMASGTINNGQTLRAQVRASPSSGGTVRAVVQVGGGKASFTVASADTTPNPFSWPDVGNRVAGTAVTSAAHTISGIDTATSVVSIGGDPSARYSINGGAFTNVPGATVNPGDSVRLMLTAGAAGTTVSAALDIGGTTGSWNLTSRDTTPDAFSFIGQNDPPLTVATSAPVTITGINVPVSVIVTGNPTALISINGGAFTTKGTIANGQTLSARVTASAKAGATVQATVTLGGVKAGFVVTATGE